ncbi:hypothetical protein [Rhodanobacter terrae]|uniref:Secreted protein n=1 Tax=Rhodanobacter terrae TaxID=418647 RepID=A0ABW0SYU3_9GAMM
MRVTYWLVGCALCIAGIGNAMAASSETQGQDSSSHATLENTGSHDDNSGSGGDALGLNRDCPPARGSDNSGSTSGNDRSGGGSSGSMPARRPHLGWQSLLPGSIQ